MNRQLIIEVVEGLDEITMSNKCQCGFKADVPKGTYKKAETDPICVECLAAKRPDIFPEIVVRAAWLPSLTQQEVSNAVRVLAYCAAFPSKICEMLVRRSKDRETEDNASFPPMLELGEADQRVLATLTGKEINESIKKAAMKRMSDVFLNAVEEAVDLFGSADVDEVRAIIKDNPHMKDDAELGLRFVPLTFNEDRMSAWPMKDIAIAAYAYIRGC